MDTRSDSWRSAAMDDYFAFIDKHFWALYVCAIAWVAACIAASAVYRRAKGKPLAPRLPADAVYSDRGVSGRSLDNLCGRIGGANGILHVAVTRDEVRIFPRFPFNLMFLPEIFGLERRIPLSAITRLTEGGWGGARIVVEHLDAGRERRIELRVHDPEAFVAAVGRPVQRRD